MKKVIFFLTLFITVWYLRGGSQLSEKEVEARVRAYFSDIPVMISVAYAESNFHHWKNGSIYRGEQNPNDIGVMQINTGYHAETAARLGYNLESLDGNLAYARYLYVHEGLVPWRSSKFNANGWGKSREYKEWLARSR